MPGYRGQAMMMRDGRQVFLFNQELVGPGVASIAVCPARGRDPNPPGISFQIYFTDGNGNPANPGPFEVDIQAADLDQDAQYCTVASLTTGLNASFVGRVELPSFYSKYLRAFVNSLGNSVYTTVMATH